MTNTQLTYIRSGATAVITALAVLYSYYPNDVWITAIISAAATLGIHAIPAIQQGVTQLIPVPTKTGVVTVSEQPETTSEVAPEVVPAGNPPTEIDGMALMGLRTPVVDSPPVAEAPPVVAPEAPEAAPVAATPRLGHADSPVSADALRELANFLENLG